MPFTFSHPAIVLPLTFLPRKWYSLTGLVIGSMTPDFEYFLRMKVMSRYSHTLEGILWFDLPLAIILAFLFHNIVRDRLFENLPTFLKSRFVTYKKFDWNRYFKRNWHIVAVSIILGAASHIFWDSFTHYNAFFVQTIPALTNKVEIFGRPIPVLKILQHLSTIIGAIVIAYAVYRLPTAKTEKKEINFRYWKIMVGLTLFVISLKIFSGLNLSQYGNLIVTVIAAGLLSLTLTPILMDKKIK